MRQLDHELMPSLSTLMRSYRSTAGLTQHELATKAGLSTAAVRDLEQGRRSRPRMGSLAALSDALGLDRGQVRALERAARREAGEYAGDVRRPPGGYKGLWISVLGPLVVWRDGEPLSLGSPARQVILGLLAIDPGMPVRRERLLDLLWGERPPRTASSLVQAHVSRLRRVLWPRRSGGEQTIASAEGGYRLHVSDDELDLSVFTDLARQAATARTDGDNETACDLYEQAFRLCRGDPCADVSLLQGHPAITAVRRELSEVLLRYAEVASDQGSHDRVLRRLQALAATEPLNERVHARLMVALAGCGQQAAALRLYEELRLRLDRELGLYPGEELAETHMRLLRQDIRSLGMRVKGVTGPPALSAQLVPRQLPAAAGYFTGRGFELAALTRLLDTPDDVTPAIPVVTLTGMAGIGKSALAVYWAHQIADRFPDGQLFTDLRGFSPTGIPASAAEAIRSFLQALGVEDWRIPTDVEGQRTLYRSLLATRRVLIVLDNAQDAEQIRPLLPGAPGCFVLITSRNRLTGLVASHGAHPLPLDCLTEVQAHSLLALGLGETRVEAEPRAASELISLCARLPMALCNAIARAAAHPRVPLAELAAAMRDDQGRLDTLETGEKVTSVRAVFSWSRAKLSDRAERMFRLMAVHPGPDVTVPSAASLTGFTLRDASSALAELSDEYLVSEYMPGRYTCNDLLRSYALEIGRTHETDEERRAAVRQVLDHYLQTANLASRYLQPYRFLRVPTPSLPGVAPRELHSSAEAEEWVRAERLVLLAAIQQAADEEFSPYAWELAWTAAPFLRGAACWSVTARALERALITARRLGDVIGQIMAHQNLGWLRLRMGAYSSAHDHVEAALLLGQQLREGRYIALARLLRARVLRSQGCLPEALLEAQQSLCLYRGINDRFGEFRALTEVGWNLLKLGDRAGAEVSRAQAQQLRLSLPQ